jgi:hypothetical protein
MKSWNIVRHSIKQVFGNIQDAFRISIVIYTVQFFAALILVPAKFDEQSEIAAALQDGSFPFGSVILSGLVTLAGFAWIVVGWHRYVLLEERPTYFPKFHAGRILAYMGVSLKIGIILIPAFILAGILGAGFAGFAAAGTDTPSTAPATIALSVALIPVILLSYRLSILLPATAIGRPLTVSQAWGATKGEMGMLAMLAVITMVFTFAISTLGLGLFGAGSGAALAYQFVAGWIQMMLGASVATTLYGVYVEKRKLGFS